MVPFGNSNRAVLLASGGLDSSVTAALAREAGHELLWLTVDYGQRHAIEIDRARQVAAAMQAVKHTVLAVDLRTLGGSALTAELPVPKDRSSGERTRGIPATYVPGRNLVFLSLAAAYAEAEGVSIIYFGANVVDYSGYPDCRPEFIRAFEAAVAAGTKAGVEGTRLRVCAPLLDMTKADIIRAGVRLGAPLHLTHSCYDPVGDLACGRCDSCVIRREGFAKAGVEDPTRYAVP
ncbi:MAG TPA: 7-cyano-7-deazaguanine synthase QueC [Nitrospira sp.]|jgi:7-cyano-7-deazaguanine synthase